ncbi:MAG: hypothetical protein AABX11_05745 [Nanoarchaeota archaeon]
MESKEQTYTMSEIQDALIKIKKKVGDGENKPIMGDSELIIHKLDEVIRLLSNK